MKLFEKLKQKNLRGNLNFDEITAEDLRQLYIDEEMTDGMIADLFDVKKSKVTYKRRKLGITIRNAILDEYLLVKSDSAKEANIQAKNKILNKDNLNMISKAITHFAFRNGPVEDMHADPNSQLSEADMKTLNKFMVNRLAYVFTLIIEERWLEFDFLIRSTDQFYGHGWDEAEPDDGRIRELLELMMKDKGKVI